MRWVRGLFSLIILISVSLVSCYSLLAQASEIETSVVRLDVNSIKYSDDFEVYDTGETVLLPLHALGKLLDTQVSLDPVSMSATIVRPWDGKTTIIDLKRQVLSWGQEEIALSPTAVVGAGDYFIPISAIELLMDMHVRWAVETQTLTITVDRQLSFMRPNVLPDQPVLPTDTTPRPMQPVNRVPLLSLGAVQYVLVHEEASDLVEHPAKDVLSVDTHLQAAGIPIDFSGKVTSVFSPSRQWALERVSATYLSRSLEVVAGDSAFSIGKILQDQDIRGVRLSSPPGLAATALHAVTSVEGTVAAGAEVTLTLNGSLFGKKVAEDGHYSFTNVPLQITKTNKVEITVVEPNGTRKIEIRYLLATPRLLPKGDLQIGAGSGRVRGAEEHAWQTAVMGGSLYAGVASWLTVGGEIARQVIMGTDFVPDKPGDIVGTVGMALRASNNTIICLDWLASKNESSLLPPTQGWETTINTQLGSLAVQSIIFYRQPLLKIPRIVSDVQGYKTIAELDITKGWNLQVGYEQSRSISDLKKAAQAVLSLTSQWVPGPSSSVLLRLERNVSVSDTATLTQNYNNRNTGTELKMETSGKFVEMRTSGPIFTAAQANVELRQQMSPTTYLGAKYNGVLERKLQMPGGVLSPFLRRSNAEAGVTWMPGSFYIRAAASAQDTRSIGDQNAPYSDVQYSLAASQALGSLVIGASTSYGTNTKGSRTTETVTNSISLGMQTKFGLSGQVRIGHSQAIPNLDGAEILKGTVKSGLVLHNGLSLTFTGQAESKRAGIGWGQPDYFAGITLSQGIGFSNGGPRGFLATTGRPMSYVEGFVFIDTNKNGKLDRREKTVAGVPISLAGRRTKTDGNGRYCFQFVNTGIYKLGLDTGNLSADYTPLSDAVVVEVSANTNIRQDFAVSLNGTVDGIVFVDLNGDGAPQEDEQRLPWVKVRLDGTQECYTDNRGNFTFGNVNLGDHMLTVSPDSIPDGLVAPDGVLVRIDESALDAWGILLPLKLQP